MKTLTEDKAEEFLKKYVPVAESGMARVFAQVKEHADRIGYPLVLKIISEQALHKTEIGGVRVVASEDDLKKEYDMLKKIAEREDINLSGIYVQEHVEGKEVVIGLKNDPAFGHVVMFGIGGKYVELIKDVAFRVCPVDRGEAGRMINELRFKKILEGFRGEEPADFGFLKKTTAKISRIPSKEPRIEELDINPLMVGKKGGKVVDARIVLS